MKTVSFHGGTSGRANGKIVIVGPSDQIDQPSFPESQKSPFHVYYLLRQDIHESIKSQYEICYRDPLWYIDIEDDDQAVLFKLKWGGDV